MKILSFWFLQALSAAYKLASYEKGDKMQRVISLIDEEFRMLFQDHHRATDNTIARYLVVKALILMLIILLCSIWIANSVWTREHWIHTFLTREFSIVFFFLLLSFKSISQITELLRDAWTKAVPVLVIILSIANALYFFAIQQGEPDLFGYSLLNVNVFLVGGWIGAVIFLWLAICFVPVVVGRIVTSYVGFLMRISYRKSPENPLPCFLTWYGVSSFAIASFLNLFLLLSS